MTLPATLPDYLRPGLAILSIGLNPSINSVKAGFYFATPQNRFWRALNGSRLINEALIPGRAAIELLFEHYNIGFTDVVKRPSRSGSELRAGDYRQWAPILKEKIEQNKPDIAWFHGKVAYRQFLRYSSCQHGDITWGLQARVALPMNVIVTPNPSPANAAYSLDDLIKWYNVLAKLCGKEC